MNNKTKLYRGDRLMALFASFAVVLVSVVTVLAVRAYLSASTDAKQNKFYPMTYTNTNIEEKYGTSYTFTNANTTVTKSAKVYNLPGSDKKPVYVRVAVKWSVYNTSGENVSYKYPCDLTFTKGSGWAKSGDYYYYKQAVMPGGYTSELFSGEKVTVVQTNGNEVPTGYTVNVSVIADTVQAVTTDTADRSSWTITPSVAQSVWNVNPTTLSE